MNSKSDRVSPRTPRAVNTSPYNETVWSFLVHWFFKLNDLAVVQKQSKQSKNYRNAQPVTVMDGCCLHILTLSHVLTNDSYSSSDSIVCSERVQRTQLTGLFNWAVIQRYTVSLLETLTGCWIHKWAVSPEEERGRVTLISVISFPCFSLSDSLLQMSPLCA